MAHLALPFDITADIIFHLRGDVVTLLQSCQVCRTFLVPSRKALSAVIAFDTAIYSSGLTISPNYPYDDSKIDATHRRWNQLYAYLVKNPQYILCIEELWLNGLIRTFNENTFSALLARLVEAKRLRVLSLAFSVGIQEGWNVLPSDVSEPLHALFSSPHLHTLRIHMTERCACTIPTRVFASVAPTLKRLAVGGESIFSIIGGGWCQHQNPQQPESPLLKEKKIRLEVLEIGCVDTIKFRDFLLGPYSPYDLSGVKAIVIRTWTEPDGLGDIIKMSEGSIERLVWFHPQSRSGAFVESLWFMKRLQSLVLIVSEQEEIDAAFNFFKRGAIPDSLKEIYLYIDDPDGILSTYACHYYIDQTLGDTVAIYGRRDVRIVYLRRVKTLDERSVAMMKRYFPQLSSQARLSVYEEDMETFERSMRAMMRGQEIIFSPSR